MIPKPHVLIFNGDKFQITPETKIQYLPETAEVKQTADFLTQKINSATGFSLMPVIADESAESEQSVLLVMDEDAGLGDEGYELDVATDMILLKASAPAGLFYAVQTIRQLLPAEIESPTPVNDVSWEIRNCHVEDQPRFPWRGMLLDCCRHFMDKAFVKRYIDLLAYHKMNRFHWHLTEDQAWRIEIKRYPKLTEVGAWRDELDRLPGEPVRTGGFYTQDDIREVVAYAAERHITVVPEIEMPGHSMAALAAYPELSCTGGPFAVESRWGIYNDVYCAGSEYTFEFMENVLLEVMDLFPGEFIHIGGDECPKSRWEKCPKCQQRIADEKLADTHELQSWFIRRIEKFLTSHGRRLIGWDEILEGGLAPGATVQSWRGTDGAIAAARAGQDAINSPTSHAYFDYDIGMLNLEQVYTFNPVPEELSGEEAAHILGGECNMWTEFAPQSLIDRKVFPRILAMSESLWLGPDGREYAEFLPRVQAHYARLDFLGVTYGPEDTPFKLETRLLSNQAGWEVTILPLQADIEVRYTLDGSELTMESPLYEKPIVVTENGLLRAAPFKNGRIIWDEKQVRFTRHAALGKSVTFSLPDNERYAAPITDGLRGPRNDRLGYWRGWEGQDFTATLDLEKTMPVSHITATFLHHVTHLVYLPKKVTLAVSVDGKQFETIGEWENPPAQFRDPIQIVDFEKTFAERPVRFVRLIAENAGAVPEWHWRVGQPSWVLCDQLQVF